MPDTVLMVDTASWGALFEFCSQRTFPTICSLAFAVNAGSLFERIKDFIPKPVKVDSSYLSAIKSDLGRQHAEDILSRIKVSENVQAQKIANLDRAFNAIFVMMAGFILLVLYLADSPCFVQYPVLRYLSVLFFLPTCSYFFRRGMYMLSFSLGNRRINAEIRALKREEEGSSKALMGKQMEYVDKVIAEQDGPD